MIIGMVGRARSGKDTFANLLKEAFKDLTGEDYILIAFADELKRKVAEDFKLTHDQLYGEDKEKLDERYPKGDTFWTAREILQFMGTEAYRAIDDNFWINKLIDNIDKNCYNNVIITDIRCPNELKVVEKFHGKSIKIIRDDAPEVHGGRWHASEIMLDSINDCDFMVSNNGTLEDLGELAYSLAHRLTTVQRVARSKNKKMEVNIDG